MGRGRRLGGDGLFLFGDLHFFGPLGWRRRIALVVARIALLDLFRHAVGARLRRRLHLFGGLLALGDLRELIVGDDLDRNAFLRRREFRNGRQRQHRGAEHDDVRDAETQKPGSEGLNFSRNATLFDPCLSC